MRVDEVQRSQDANVTHREQPDKPVTPPRQRRRGFAFRLWISIVHRLDGDKLEIKFKTGTKTLLARFVTPVT